MPGFHIEHFGCRAARADGEAIAGNLRAIREREPFAADVVIVNTCSVTAEADRAARAFIRRANRRNPDAKIVVTGCYAQRAPEELAAMAGVVAVVGNSHKALVPEIIRELAGVADPAKVQPRRFLPVTSLLAAGGSAPIWADDRFAHSFIEEAHGSDTMLAPGAQTRPNLKIQEGCGNRCTFCVIPLTRGPSQSLPHAAVMRRVRSFVAAGGNELVLSGINLGRWGRDLEGPKGPAFAEPVRSTTFAQLARGILEETRLPRLRLSSIEPMDWNCELIALMREYGGSRLARHAHLPLQSGSDAVLRRMHRRYRPWHYAEKADALFRAAGPDLTLGADVMVGFPGETGSEFEQTLAFIRSLPFGYLHLFPFSPRPGTRGWELHRADPVAAPVVEQHMAALRMLAAEKSRAHRRQFAGRTLDAITLHTPAALAARGSTAALTENFLPVELEGSFAANQLMRVRVANFNADGDLLCVPESALVSQ
jgi:threonylcarbamoyladenosine tRNA methylthiotransferase MtaB